MLEPSSQLEKVPVQGSMQARHAPFKSSRAIWFEDRVHRDKEMASPNAKPNKRNKGAIFPGVSSFPAEEERPEPCEGPVKGLCRGHPDNL
jgi:hypothetical protein